MTKWLLAAVVLAVGCTLVVGQYASAAGQQHVTVVEAGAKFPNRTYILTLPHRTKLNAGRVHVLENGDSVIDLKVAPVGAKEGIKAGNVLLIDASNSMRGAPIAAAMASARQFADRRAPNQPLAVIAFNDHSTVVVPFTTDNGEINSALAKTPPLHEGTHIYDALDRAAALVKGSNLDSASVVLLSDGADVGSKLDPAKVEENLKSEHIRIFAVGLRSGAYNPTTLTSLAGKTKGTYTEASTQSLQSIYAALGYQLANEYFVSYRSLAEPSKTVRVKVAVDGLGSDVSAYTSPALETSVLRPFDRSVSTKILDSTITMLIIAFAILGLLVGGVWLAVRKPPQSLPDRLSQFVHIPTEEEARQRKHEVADVLGQKSDRSLRDLRWWRQFADDVELAAITTSAGALMLWFVVGGIVFALIMTLIVGPLLGVLCVFAGPLAARLYVSNKLKRRRNRFQEQLPDNLEVLASALRAGHSLVGGLAVVVDDAPEPSKSEFRRVVADEQLGVPLEDALSVVVRRMDSIDLDQVAVVASLQRDAGGNAAEVLDQVVENIRGRMEIRRLVKTLTAQGRMARWIVSFIPLGLLIAILILDPVYAHPLFHRTLGQIALVIAAILSITGSLVIRKIVDIKV